MGDNCSSNEVSDNDYCSGDNEDDDDDMAVGAFYQVFNEVIWAGTILWASLAQNAEPVWSSSDEVTSGLADRLWTRDYMVIIRTKH